MYLLSRFYRAFVEKCASLTLIFLNAPNQSCTPTKHTRSCSPPNQFNCFTISFVRLKNVCHREASLPKNARLGLQKKNPRFGTSVCCYYYSMGCWDLGEKLWTEITLLTISSGF